MLEPYEIRDNRSFIIMEKDARIVQLHNLRVKHRSLELHSFFKSKRIRHKLFADKVQKHIEWMVKGLVPPAGDWMLQRLTGDAKQRFVLLYLNEESNDG